MTREIKLEASWKTLLRDEFEKEYMRELRNFLQRESKLKKIIYPRPQEIFSALNLTPFEKVKVVILGQDPYHGPRQAHGLSFSVLPPTPAPPSLQNIYKELKSDLGLEIPPHGYLLSWALQGVLLLNTVLTVERGKANSHQGKGWEIFTDKILALLNEKRDHLVFVLWGSYAQQKIPMIDSKRHLILKSPHPSPLSAYRGFFGQRPFSKINRYLLQTHQTPIDWELPPCPVPNREDGDQGPQQRSESLEMR